VDVSGVACDGSGNVVITYTVTNDCDDTQFTKDCIQPVQTAPMEDDFTCPTFEPVSCEEALGLTTTDYAVFSFDNGGSGGCLITYTATPTAVEVTGVDCNGGSVVITYTVTNDCDASEFTKDCIQPVLAAPTLDDFTCPELPALTCEEAPNLSLADIAEVTFNNGGTGTCQINYTATASALDKSNITCEGGFIVVTFSVSNDCDESTFTQDCTIEVLPIPAIELICPENDEVIPACLTQTEVDGLFADFLASFGYTGGCSDVLAGFDGTPAAPLACGGSTTVLFRAQNGCEDLTCERTFTVLAAPPVELNCPENVELPACLSQNAIDGMYNDFLNQFSYEGGCNAVASFDDVPEAPSACGGSVSVTYRVTSDCEPDRVCTRTFTAPAPIYELVCPDEVLTLACDEELPAPLTTLPVFSNCGLPACDSGTDDCISASFLGVVAHEDGSQTLRYSVNSDCFQDVSYVAFSLPTGTVALTPADGSTYTGLLGNYQVENPGGQPFYGIKFETIGDAFNTGETEVFEFTLPAGVDPSQVTVAVKAATEVYSIDLSTTCLPGATNGTLPAELISETSNGATGCAGDPIVWTRTYRAITDCGQELFCTQEITVEPDTEAPVITPNFDIPAEGGTMVVECNNADPDWDPFIMGVGDVTVTDACSSVEVTFEDIEVDELPNGDCSETPGISLWACTWTATDACDNTSTFTIYMKIVDTTPPTLDPEFPLELTVDCDNIPDPIAPTGTDNCSNVSGEFVSEMVMTTECTGTYDLVRRYDLSDYCGNSSTIEQIIHVVDNQAPTLEPQGDYFDGLSDGAVVQLPCSEADALIADTGFATVSDNCDPDPEVTSNINLLDNVDCSNEGYAYAIEVALTATDDCGNAKTMHFRFEFIDTEPPVLQNVPADACMDELPPVPDNVFAIDACSFIPPNQVWLVESGPEACGDGGLAVTRTWYAEDNCGNVDSATQIIVLDSPGDLTVGLTDPDAGVIPDGGTVTTDADCTAPDFGVEAYIRENLTLSGYCIVGTITVLSEPLAEGSCPDDAFLLQTQVTVTVTDICGNSADYTVIVTVVDETGPVFTEDLAGTYFLSCGDELVPPLVTDACTEVVSIDYEWIDDPAASCPDDEVQLYTVRWTAIDACGNSSQAEQEVRIIDNDGPVFNGLPNDACGTGDLSTAVVTAVDECTGADLGIIEPTIEVSTLEGCGTVTTYTWEAADACGNVSTATRYLIETDDTPPTIVFQHPLLAGSTEEEPIVINCADLLLGEDGLPDFGPDAVVLEDNCVGQGELTLDIELLENTCTEEDYLGIYEYTWTGTDVCGNPVTAVRTIEFVDNEAPVFYPLPPAFLTVYCDADLPAVPDLQIVDFCSAAELTFEAVDMPTPQGYVQVRTWTATDACGNSDTFVQRIFVIEEAFECEFELQPKKLFCGTKNNQITVNVTGGTAPYTYEWNMPDCDGIMTAGMDTETLTFTSGYSTQNFVVTITDANGCTQVCTYEVDCIKRGGPNNGPGNGPGNSNGNGNGNLTLYPNPTNSQLTIEAPQLIGQSVIMTIQDARGRRVQRHQIGEWTEAPQTWSVDELPVGMYIITLHAADGTTLAEQFIKSHY
jgi:hypothetical protein